MTETQDRIPLGRAQARVFAWYLTTWNLSLGAASRQLGAGPRVARGKSAYETDGGTARFLPKKWRRPAVSRRALVVLSRAPSLDRPDLRMKTGRS